MNNLDLPSQLTDKIDRRAFVASTLAVLGTSALALFPENSMAGNLNADPQLLTVRDIINLIIRNTPGAPFPQTVDTIKAGNEDTPVTGIVTTMFATVDVIQQAIALKANFIIAHEPTWYNHQDETTWLGQDSTYQYKRNLLDSHGITVWRCHDDIHTFKPDGVLTGVLNVLGWESFYDSKTPNVITLPPTSLEKLVKHLKEKIGATHVRVSGTLSQVCQRIALMPGAAGGKRQIQMLIDQKPDLLIVGEVSEWETIEYIRDAQASGAKRSLIVMGHALSEEPGMAWMRDWLTPKVQNIKVTHIPSRDPFTWM